MTTQSRVKLQDFKIDNMLFNLLEDCYNLEYADVASYFYQLTLNTLESEPNMIGPYRVPTGKTVPVRGSRPSRLNVVKKVKEPQDSGLSIWVVRGFYPNTGVPFKLCLWKRGFPGGSIFDIGCKITLGKLSSVKEKAGINISKIVKYIEDTSERILLGEPIDTIEKPNNPFKAEYRLLTPKKLSKHAKKKNDGTAKSQSNNRKRNASKRKK